MQYTSTSLPEFGEKHTFSFNDQLLFIKSTFDLACMYIIESGIKARNYFITVTF